MLTVQDDPGYLREALQFGARDYLIKPPTIDELLSTINKTHEIGRMERERVTRLHTAVIEEAEEEMADANGFAVAVYSPKGGVGCTFLASNLAVAAQAGDRSVVLVDCDLQYGGVGLFFNEQARSSIDELAPRINDLDRNVLRDAVVTHQDSGVRLILAPNRPEQAEHVRGDQLAGLIRYLRKAYSLVIVDTGSSLDSQTMDVLAACDQVVLVMTQDIPSINDIRQLLNFAPKIGLADGKISLVLNQYHKRINITPDQISKNLRREFAAVVPLDNRTAIPSINRGVPFMLSVEGRSLPIGEAVQALADRVVERQMVAV
jgi:pilus assembly protein CpaE